MNLNTDNIVTVVIGGVSTSYTTIADAWKYAAEHSSADQPATVFLMRDEEISSELQVREGQNITLEMAEGVTLSDTTRTIYVYGGTFTLNSGTIVCSDSSNDAIEVYRGGTATINGGTVRAVSSAVYAYGTGTQVVINGGEFSGTLTVRNGWGADTTITITGGTFTGTESPLRGYGTDSPIFSMLAEGAVCRWENGTPLTASELAADKLNPGTVTVSVVTCEHKNTVLHNLGSSTHQSFCEDCGTLLGNPEPCAYAWEDGAAAGQCRCGSTLKLTLLISSSLSLQYSGQELKPP